MYVRLCDWSMHESNSQSVEVYYLRCNNMQGLQEANMYVELQVYISYALRDVQMKAFLLPFLT